MNLYSPAGPDRAWQIRDIITAIKQGRVLQHRPDGWVLVGRLDVVRLHPEVAEWITQRMNLQLDFTFPSGHETYTLGNNGRKPKESK